jgi:hypothetical protein
MVFNHGFWRYDCRAKEEVLQDPLSFCLDLTFYMAIARHAMKLIYGQTDRSATITDQFVFFPKIPHPVILARIQNL